MAEHRVPMLGASWRRFEDPAVSRDPRVRAVVGALATLPAPAPRDEFRAELRAQLVAIAPRIIAESAEFVEVAAGATAGSRAGATGKPRHTDRAIARVPRVRLGRPLAVAASVITAFAMLFGGAVWMSQKALPGDTLYGLKRASESWQLATASGGRAKAGDYLSFARTRIDEARDLASRSDAGTAGSHTASLITSTLASADHDVAAASSLVGWQALKSNSASPLGVITSRAPDLLSRLNGLTAALPAGPVRDRAQASADLVTAAMQRARQLAPVAGCLQNPAADRLGPIPAACATPVTPGSNTHPVTTPTSAQRTKGHTVGPNSAKASTSPVAQHSGTPTGSGSGGSSSAGGGGIINLPSLLPTSTATLPVTVNSCTLGVHLGPINIGVGGCS